MSRGFFAIAQLLRLSVTCTSVLTNGYLRTSLKIRIYTLSVQWYRRTPTFTCTWVKNLEQCFDSSITVDAVDKTLLVVVMEFCWRYNVVFWEIFSYWSLKCLYATPLQRRIPNDRRPWLTSLSSVQSLQHNVRPRSRIRQSVSGR